MEGTAALDRNLEVTMATNAWQQPAAIGPSAATTTVTVFLLRIFFGEHDYGVEKVRARMCDINWHVLSSAALMLVQWMMLPPAAVCMQVAVLW